ncbi:hypothetical protein HWV62_43124 [Athelia sp. TMB]|nr:hypothetical protein HWV62_43124 [Athelia sp. TMB]
MHAGANSSAKCIKHPPTHLELERLQIYAKYIRQLELHGHDLTARLGSGALVALCADRTEEILPNLLTLKLTENDRQPLDGLYFLIGQKLTSISLYLSATACDEIKCLHFMDTLRKRSRFIEKFEISGPGISLNCKAFAHLSSLPHVQVLGVKVPNSDEFKRLPVSLQPFPDLREVTIWTTYLSTATEMLHRMKPSVLEVLIFHIEDTPCACDVDDLFATMVQHCCCTLKRVYGFQDEYSDNVGRTEYTYSFRPLLAFPNLEYVWINACISFENMDNTLIHDMACAWPHLRELDLGSTSCWGLPSHVTLEGLLEFCKHCPELSSLGLTMDASSTAPPPPTPDLEASNPHMEALRLGNSKIGVNQVRAVSRFLRRIYPNLSELSCCKEDGTAGWLLIRVAWLMVGDIVTTEDDGGPMAAYWTE